MAYAAYREHPLRTTANATSFHVLEVTVACVDARRIRHAVSQCAGAGVVRCEPLVGDHGSNESDVPRARLMVRLPLASYAQVLHALIDAVPSGEIGRFLSWREHLARRGFRDDR